MTDNAPVGNVRIGDVLTRGRRAYTVVALTDDPARAWVCGELHHGMVDGGGTLVDVREGFQVLPTHASMTP